MKKLSYLIPVLFIIAVSTSAFPSNPEKHLIGKWKFDVKNAPWEYQKGELLFEHSGGDLKGKVLFDRARNISTSSIKIDAESKITITLYVEGTIVKVIGTIDKDKFIGIAEVDNVDTLDFSAEKVAN